MPHFLRRALLAAPLALALVLFCPSVRAAEPPEPLEARVEAFRQQYGLSAQNFAVSFLDLTTGERYGYNEETMMLAASTFKLPLNLYYYELQADGSIQGSDYIADTGCTLDECHRLSLVDSDNDVSLAMLYKIGSFYTYKTEMRRYFSMTDDEIDPRYYWDNYYCTRMMLDTLQYLYDNRSRFPEMLGYMLQAQPDSYFRQLLRDCPVAHKYGFLSENEEKPNGMIENDAGIIFAAHPFLLAVYSEDAGGTCSRAAVLFRDYVEDLLCYHAQCRAEQRSFLAAKRDAFLQGRPLMEPVRRRPGWTAQPLAQ